MREENVEYLSGEVQEILATPPAWVATWGAVVLISAVLLMALVGVAFHYPETVAGELTLTTETPPILVFSQKSDYVSELKFKSNNFVEAGDVLAVFPSNNADYKDVLTLENDLETVGQFELEKLRSYHPNKILKVGELSQAYSNFINAFELLPLDETGQIDYSIVVAVENDNAQLERQMMALEASIEGANEELKSLETEFKNAVHVYGESVDTTKADLLFKADSAVKKKKADIKAKKLQIEKIRQDISKANMRKLQAQTQQKAGAGEAIYRLNQQLDVLKKEIKTWKEKYLIMAPSEGKLQFYSDLKVGQLVEQGVQLFTIVPKGAGNKYVGKVKLPDDRSGKVKEKQLVNIKFSRYPFREFGTVRGKVSKVYPVAKDNAFYADVVLENGLVTSQNRELEFSQQMAGKAEIVTNNRLFISRLFEKLF